MTGRRMISLRQLQHQCMVQEREFVSFSMPDQSRPLTYLGKISQYPSIDEIEAREGFVMAPFINEKSPVLHLSKDIVFKGWEDELNSELIDTLPDIYVDNEEVITNPGDDFRVDFRLEQVADDQAAYFNRVEELISMIRSGRAEKVVISRIKELEGFPAGILPSLFKHLCERYPQAFVYLFYSPSSGIWMGATPETLVSVSEDRFTTMALAGTKAYSEDTRVAWTEKEIREQAHVLHYIQDKLAVAGFPFHESNLQTIRAAKVLHLRSMFSGLLRNGPADWRELVKALFPTPAVCGTGETQALELISILEDHRREYYSGFLGPYSDDGNTDIFVNLRCMKVAGGRATLYAGGGILAGSDPSHEWEETELKFRTLSDVIIETIQDLN